MENPDEPKFIADVMVGRLARWLRVLGFDVLYSNRYGDDEILRIAAAEDRIILTRDRGLRDRGRGQRIVFIASGDYASQVEQVLESLGTSEVRVFSRCMECNHALEKIDKEAVFERVPPYVYLTQEEFANCPSCRRIYWHGSHADGIKSKVNRWMKG